MINGIPLQNVPARSDRVKNGLAMTTFVPALPRHVEDEIPRQALIIEHISGGHLNGRNLDAHQEVRKSLSHSIFGTSERRKDWSPVNNNEAVAPGRQSGHCGPSL